MFNPDAAANKTKMVAWFVSNCNARNRRLEYARELAKHVQVKEAKFFVRALQTATPRWISMAAAAA